MIAAMSVFVMAVAPQEPVVVHEDLQYSEVAKQPRRNRLDLFVPAAESPPPLVMFVHGGSWTGGSKDHFEAVGETFAERGVACATINTRLFPFSTPDHMVVDCAHALGFLHQHGDEYGYDGDQLFVMGHSSGAHLCSWLAYDERKLKLAGVPRRALRGAVLLSGVYDVRARHRSLDAVFGGDAEMRYRASTWLYADASDCPTYVAWAQRELPGLSLCGQLLSDVLISNGVPVQTAFYKQRSHTSYIFQFGSRRDVVTDSVMNFLRDPQASEATKRRRANASRGLVWVAADAREQRLGEALAKVCEPAGVEVVTLRLANPDGERVTAAFRKLRVDRERAGGQQPVVWFIGGYGAGGYAVAASALTARADKIGGRIVAGAPLAERSLRRAGYEPQAFRSLGKAPLLSICGDQDEPQLRADARSRSNQLLRQGCEVAPYELFGTTTERALSELDMEDDLVRPMLWTFLGVM